MLSLIVFYTIQHAIHSCALLPTSSGYWSDQISFETSRKYRFTFLQLHTHRGKIVIHNFKPTNIVKRIIYTITQCSIRDQAVSNVSYLVVLKLRGWQSDCNAPTNFIVKISVALKWSRDIVSVLAAQLRLRAHNGKCQRQPLSKCVSHTSSKYTNKRSQPAPGSCRTFTISSEKLSPRLMSRTEAEDSKQRVITQETLLPLCCQSLTWEHSK